MTAVTTNQRDTYFMRHAARLAMRGHGSAEPNPLVGCVIVDANDIVIGWGYHRKFGEAHAEIHALQRAGDHARGATCYVTLEPCTHIGKTGPCVETLIKAGIKRVVIGRRDTTPHAHGGAKRLEKAGIEVCWLDNDPFVRSVSEPFFHRLATHRPWVIAKWAQTLDGYIATRAGDSQWISSVRSRTMVHRQRSRVDVILTGIGTVLHDDPRLTARCRTIRRTARRVIIDANLELPMTSKLVQTACDIPVIVFCTQTTRDNRTSYVHELTERGIEIIACSNGNEVALDEVLQLLVKRYDTATVLVEAGAGLLGRLFSQALVNEAWVFIGPILLGDEHSLPPARGNTVQQLTDGIALDVIDQRRRGDDVMLRYLTR